MQTTPGLKFGFESKEALGSVREQLETSGYAHLTRGGSCHVVDSVASHAWNYLESVDVYRERKESWPYGKPVRGPLFRAIRDYEGLNPLFSEPFELGMANLIGSEVRVVQEFILYMTFPNSNHDPAKWRVPWAGWHNDFTGDGTGRTPGYLAFVLLSDTETCGGSPVFLSGSQRLSEVIAPQHASAIMKQLSKKSTLLERLWDRREGAPGALVGERCTVDGVDLEIRDMTGKAGDVFLLNALLLHAPTENERGDARLAAKCFLQLNQ